MAMNHCSGIRYITQSAVILRRPSGARASKDAAANDAAAADLQHRRARGPSFETPGVALRARRAPQDDGALEADSESGRATQDDGA
ncbi:hypothetical protein RPC_4761 [Rhodopseudomonas palustris BisB18]|uniref:Uncharacterized protein n=1 Tax=Rhodopseudomonas palustris (strain BisB18) TaxID=316056 RepID=Q20X53_RHOPB